MKTSRLEAFSDGVLAIVITIMVLEMKVPKGHLFSDLKETIPIFLSYAGSFLFIGIYWLHHHHLFQTSKTVNAKILWANLNLLFWVSLMPFATSWLNESYLSKSSVILYSFVIFISGFSYKILAHLVVKNEGKYSTLAKEFEKDRKGLLTGVLNLLAVGLAFFYPTVSVIILILVAISWIVPDKRFENAYKKQE